MKLEPFALERFQSIWEHSVPWNLAESGVHPLTVGELLAMSGEGASLPDVLLGYPQTNGTLDLRRAIAGMYPGATPDHVEVTNGGSEANCVVMMRLVEPGDRIVFMSPNYLQATGLARGLGAEIVPWPLRLEGAGDRATWSFDLDELARLVTPKTRAILLCNPNNPTGMRLDEAALDAICRIAARSGAWVISDEIYRGAERIDKRTSTVWGRYERAIVTSGLSKAYGLPGLRIGWVVAPVELTSELWGVHDYTTIAPGAINDRLARVALAPACRARLLARTQSIIRSNYPIVRDWIASHDGLDHAAPDAGAIVFVRYRHPVPSEALVSRLREEHGVLLVAGTHFDMDGFVRVGFGAERAHMAEALAIIGAFFDALLTHAG
jgi:aspartate/methionine/tyrosine aminotransferase